MVLSMLSSFSPRETAVTYILTLDEKEKCS